MCGIAGIWGHGNIKKMTKILNHRGPDDSGYYQNKSIKLGANLLSIIDIGKGQQPIFNENKSLVIVYNGEIFNYLELKKDLIKQGHIFKTNTDTEVIIHAYEQYGYDCLNKFNGMFAFCIYDIKKKIFFIARDRFGEKPLYYSFTNNNFLFASEIKSILTQIKIEPKIPSYFMATESSLLKDTFYKNIYSLLPSHYIIFNGQNIKTYKYWDFPKEPDSFKSKKFYIDKLRFLIKDSINIRLGKDVETGSFLSGGLDSSIITCLSKPQKIFSCHYPYGPKYDEIQYAKLIAKKLKIQHIIITPTYKLFKQNLNKILWYLDEPIASASAFSTFMLAHEASKHNIKVLLNGEGADEIFGGYMRYLIMLNANTPILKNYSSLLSFFTTYKNTLKPYEKYYYLTRRSIKNSQKIKSIIKNVFSLRKNVIDNMGISDFKITFPSLITMNDRATSAYGLENRSPYLDYRIVELGFQIPTYLKIKGYTTKYLLREASKGLIPEKIRLRKDKKGLITPFNIWLNNNLKSWKEQKLSTFYKRNIKLSNDNNRGEFDRTDYTKLCLELIFENIEKYNFK